MEGHLMTTGVMRLDFQHAACAHSTGLVLNVGANEDPAGIRQRFGSRVINCDIEAWDATMGRPNVVDKLFDANVFPWPFADDYAEVVILGDILEHFPFERMVLILKEARRVATELCVTIPEDTRVNEAQAGKDWEVGKYNLHTIVATEAVVRDALAQSGWKSYIFLKTEWGFSDDKGVPIEGYCLMAHRA